MTIRATTILNKTGDTSIVWTEDRDKEMVEIIRKKMAEGISFFIIEPRFFGLLPSKKTKLQRPEDATAGRALSIPDEDFLRFVESGSGEFVKTPDGPVKTKGRAKTAEQVASTQTVGVRQLKGG